MITKRGCYTTWLVVLGGFLLTNCAPTWSNSPQFYFGEANDKYRAIEAIQAVEKTQPAQAIQAYEEYVKEEKSFTQSFVECQENLQEVLTVMQGSVGGGSSLSEPAGLGFPSTYSRRLEALVGAHQGLGRVHLGKGNFEEGEKHVTQAIELIKSKAIAPAKLSLSLLESYELLKAIQEGKGKRGKALIANLNASLLQDHIQSEGGVEDFYLEKVFLFGGKSKKQMKEINEFVKQVNYHRVDQHSAQVMAVAGGVMAMNAALQSTMANQALAKSGGVTTPQVQRMRMNAQMAQFQSQMFRKMTQMAAGQTQNMTLTQTPWGLPNFGQQMVDPRMGVNPDGIIKRFAGDAVNSGGGPPLQAQAQEVTQQVDALAALRQAGGNDAKMQQLSKFADAFNNFLTLVQEIK